MLWWTLLFYPSFSSPPKYITLRGVYNVNKFHKSNFLYLTVSLTYLITVIINFNSFICFQISFGRCRRYGLRKPMFLRSLLLSFHGSRGYHECQPIWSYWFINQLRIGIAFIFPVKSALSRDRGINSVSDYATKALDRVDSASWSSLIEKAP